MTRTLMMHLPGLARALGPWLVVSLALLGAWPGFANAGGFYRVAECTPAHPGTPDASVEGTTTSYSASTSCASGNWLQVQSAGASQPGDAKQWVYAAPPGTRIKQVTAGYDLVGDESPDGNRSYFFIRRFGQAQQENLSVVGLGSTGGTYDSSVQDPGPLAAVGVGTFCSKATGTCGYAPGQFARLATASFLMEDTSPPGRPVIAGPGPAGEWVGGHTQLVVGETDVGSGVDHTTVAVDGQQVLTDTVCEAGRDADGYVDRMAPCDALELRSHDLDTSAPQFHEGPGNDVRVCTHEYGFAAASTCSVTSLKVDNAAPAAPAALSVSGGAGWHRDNDFDLTWENPVQDHAPVAAATVEIEGPAGHVSTTTRTAPDIEAIDDLTLPAVGEYTARVYLRDAAGNESPATAAQTVLRFDDTRPPLSQPQIANGWLSRRELEAGFDQSWQRPRDPEVPPSGIAGYRVVVDRYPGTDPCGDAPDPRTCGMPLTELGIDNNSRTIRLGDLAEGSNWVHVVAVSGSGVRASEVGRTELKVDLTDPVTRLAGAQGGWVNHPVELTALAEDALSGMEDTDEFPDDDPPRTVISIDGEEIEEHDASVSASVREDGSHRIRYWARDLAGNENDGADGNAGPGSATVRIDTGDPQVAFANSQDPSDPDLLEATASDELSGVVDGQISIRERGATQWQELPTHATEGRLLARADSNEMSEDVDYEFRAEAVDAAGNTAATTSRLNGTEMVQRGPFRPAAQFTGLAVNGRSKARLAYDASARATGRLVDLEGAPIGGAAIEVIERYAGGSKRTERSVATRTDRSGRFSVLLPKGPSRSLQVRFAGDRRYLGAVSGSARVAVKGAVSLRAPRRVRAGDRAVFRGRVRGRGADFSRQGKSLEVQVRVGRRWKTVGRSIRSDARGRFRLRYRFVASYTRPVRYRFRAVVLRERGWPYLPARSRIRSLVVAP